MGVASCNAHKRLGKVEAQKRKDEFASAVIKSIKEIQKDD
jgi:hypothetical protein